MEKYLSEAGEKHVLFTKNMLNDFVLNKWNKKDISIILLNEKKEEMFYIDMIISTISDTFVFFIGGAGTYISQSTALCNKDDEIDDNEKIKIECTLNLYKNSIIESGEYMGYTIEYYAIKECDL